MGRAGGPAPWRARAMGSAQASKPSGSPAPGTASRRPDRSTGVGSPRLQPHPSLVHQFINRQPRTILFVVGPWRRDSAGSRKGYRNGHTRARVVGPQKTGPTWRCRRTRTPGFGSARWLMEQTYLTGFRCHVGGKPSRQSTLRSPGATGSVVIPLPRPACRRCPLEAAAAVRPPPVQTG